ncbi:glycosyl hydrolase family 47-domain-containing protein [Halteromyces radiatus]|uniref:glycosyl hydrolase family 47-domain-containing protein n=1 Tax=Halteromyces radiatus TaxID=101107 RepID=UPI00221E47BB|nr:glycosyl hydrolase family 47-domain-containing protein [Halteromyces radiatus]KAI8089996.1 glycosyl hydrolase family 47-domain-containing protein [Halteromyces radiatus]
MFFHGWNNYMQHAFPEDELKPLSCKGLGSNKYSYDSSNDVLGDYSLTLVDVLDTLAIIGTQEQFEQAVYQVLNEVSFDKNNKVQVFELNIRALGGLLSAHILASDPSFGHQIEHYDGGLLRLAEDLAQRFLPAFKHSKSGIPFPRVNLRHGVPKTETVETCTAGAGSLILEFGVLSRLTGDPQYEEVAKKALQAIWERRSELDLVGNVINIQTGQWIHTASSTGAGIDSFFEYLLKAYILFGEEDYLDMFETSYEAIMQHIVDRSGYLYRNVHMDSGMLMATWIDSLSAFMPGVQVLYGDLESAIKGHLVFYNIWQQYHALPERFDFFQQKADIHSYPLRPEFVESTYYLYQATKDPFYLQVGEMIMEDLNNRTRLPCGFASISDLRTGQLDDRMESFMLSETLKYLYLLFDVDNSINRMDSNFVFTTEGHFLPLAGQYLKHSIIYRSSSSSTTTPLKLSNHCRKYKPSAFSTSTAGKSTHQQRNGSVIERSSTFDMTSIPYLPLSDYAAKLTGNRLNTTTISSSPRLLYREGYCTSPLSNSRSFELSFGQDHRLAYRQASPKLIDIMGGLISKSLSGLKIELTKLPRSLEGGYIITGG